MKPMRPTRPHMQLRLDTALQQPPHIRHRIIPKHLRRTHIHKRLRQPRQVRRPRRRRIAIRPALAPVQQAPPTERVLPPAPDTPRRPLSRRHARARARAVQHRTHQHLRTEGRELAPILRGPWMVCSVCVMDGSERSAAVRALSICSTASRWAGMSAVVRSSEVGGRASIEAMMSGSKGGRGRRFSVAILWRLVSIGLSVSLEWSVEGSYQRLDERAVF